MILDCADRGLLATVLELADGRGAAPTGEEIARALGIPAEFSSFLERRLQRDRELGLLDRDEHGGWHPTPAGRAAATTSALAPLAEPRQAETARSGTGDALPPAPTAPSPTRPSSERAGSSRAAAPGEDAGSDRAEAAPDDAVRGEYAAAE